MSKGITPVIAIILLLLITISMVGFAFVFFGRVTSTSGAQIENATQQLVQQAGARFAIEGYDKNHIYIRNTGNVPITSLAFYVENTLVPNAGPASLAPGALGTYNLDDGQLAQLSEPAALKVTSGGYSDQTTADFYKSYKIAYWKLNEGSGSVAKDSSENQNDGTITAASWTSGKYGNALDIDAGFEYAEKDVTDFSLSVMTIEFWIKPDVVSSGWRDLVGIRGSPDITRFHMDSSDNSIVFYGIEGCGSLDSNFIPAPGQWHHVVGTLDGTTARVYVNGILRNSFACSGSKQFTSLIVGSSSEVFDGALDEVRILNIARSMTTS